LDDVPARSRTVQDDVREQQLALLLNLQRSQSRTGSDARDEFGNRYELKTVTTSSMTTGRDIGPDYLDRLGQSYVVCARGTNTDYGFSPSDIYFLAPHMMEDWIKVIESRIGGDRVLVDAAIEALRAVDFEGDLERLRYVGYRGITLNNPKVSWRYITSHGVRLEGQPALALRELVAAHPILPPQRPT
jgi:hypothetical protein